MKYNNDNSKNVIVLSWPSACMNKNIHHIWCPWEYVFRVQFNSEYSKVQFIISVYNFRMTLIGLFYHIFLCLSVMAVSSPTLSLDSNTGEFCYLFFDNNLGLLYYNLVWPIVVLLLVWSNLSSQKMSEHTVQIVFLHPISFIILCLVFSLCFRFT